MVLIVLKSYTSETILTLSILNSTLATLNNFPTPFFTTIRPNPCRHSVPPFGLFYFSMNSTNHLIHFNLYAIRTDITPRNSNKLSDIIQFLLACFETIYCFESNYYLFGANTIQGVLVSASKNTV